MTQKKKTECMKWIIFVSFVILIIDGFRSLLVGLFEVDIFAEIFGDSTTFRILNLIFGIAAAVLATLVCLRAYKKMPANQKNASTTNTGAKTSSNANSNTGSNATSNTASNADSAKSTQSTSSQKSASSTSQTSTSTKKSD